ncbi:MAG: PorP/SprF family type IX secretion system membrane protein [Flavobacteriaceae bacterium]
MCLKSPSKTIFPLFFVLCFYTAKAQYRMPVYTDYLTDNYYVLHPAMAGAHYEGLKLRTSYRTQWLGIANAPSMQTLNAHARVGDKSGVGGLFFHDTNGFQSQLGFQGTYAHHINFYRSRAEVNQLSFGLSAGGSFHRHDQSTFNPTNDPIILGTNVSSSSMFVDVGLTYNYVSLYAHLTIQNLLFVGNNINDQVLLNKPKRLLASVGNFFEIQSDWALEPSVLVDYIQYVDRPNVDVNLKSHHNIRETQLWVGTSYRKGLTNTLTTNNNTPYSEPFSQLSAILGMRHNKWSFSYTYTVGIGDIKINNSGFHQITLGIDILSDEYRPTTIRGIL